MTLFLYNRLLKHFVDEQRNQLENDKLHVTYFISGYKKKAKHDGREKQVLFD